MTEVTTEPVTGTESIADLIGELGEILRPAWKQISDGIPAWHPRAEGEDGGEGGEGEPDDAPVGETPEQLAIRKANAEAKKYRLQAREAQEALKKHEDAGKSELEKAQAGMTAAEIRANNAELRLMKIEIAAELGIPVSQANRLQGTDEESIKKDAEEYAKELGLDEEADVASRRGQSVRRGADTGAGARRSVQKPEDMNGRIFGAVRGAR